MKEGENAVFVERNASSAFDGFARRANQTVDEARARVFFAFFLQSVQLFPIMICVGTVIAKSHLLLRADTWREDVERNGSIECSWCPTIGIRRT